MEEAMEEVKVAFVGNAYSAVGDGPYAAQERHAREQTEAINREAARGYHFVQAVHASGGMFLYFKRPRKSAAPPPNSRRGKP